MHSEFVSKLSSGKFWLTIISGIVFAYATVKRILSAEAVATIVTMVFISYFQKNPEPNTGETTTQTTENKTTEVKDNMEVKL